MTLSYQNTVAETVANDYRAAAIFEKYGIDFCCHGKISIDEACEKRHVMTEEVMRDLKSLTDSNSCCFNYSSLPPSMLADHIEEKHHRYIEEKTPVIQHYLDKVCSVHGSHHPELQEINRLFQASAADMAQHMKKEELILFPRIRKLESLTNNPVETSTIQPGLLQTPIHMMMEEHAVEGDRFQAIEELTHHFQPPADACNTFKVTYALLQEFETDLHLHIHLENNILFPKAIELENRLLN
jgi:regulator of cell morphogenesis and NO signaling